jgi:hypothetical protein
MLSDDVERLEMVEIAHRADFDRGVMLGIVDRGALVRQGKSRTGSRRFPAKTG